MNKEKIYAYIEDLEDKAKASDSFFQERNDLYIENQQLKKQKADVVEYVKKHFQDDEGIICKYVGDNACEINENFIDELLRMLGEIDETSICK